MSRSFHRLPPHSNPTPDSECRCAPNRRRAFGSRIYNAALGVVDRFASENRPEQLDGGRRVGGRQNNARKFWLFLNSLLRSVGRIERHDITARGFLARLLDQLPNLILGCCKAVIPTAFRRGLFTQCREFFFRYGLQPLGHALVLNVAGNAHGLGSSMFCGHHRSPTFYGIWRMNANSSLNGNVQFQVLSAPVANSPCDFPPARTVRRHRCRLRPNPAW